MAACNCLFLSPSETFLLNYEVFASVEILSGLQAGDTIVISSIDMFEGAETLLITN